MTAKVRQSFVWDEKLKEQVQELADREQRSLSAMIQILIRGGLERKED